MPLVEQVLAQNIKDAFEKTFDVIKGEVAGSPPLIPQVVANNLAQAYDSYVKSGAPLAGALMMATPGNLASLSAAMVQNMMRGWTPGLLSYWTPVIWAGPGFIPANPTIPAALSGIAAPLENTLQKQTDDRMDAARRIANVLHTYTLQIQVLATTVPPASAVSILPIL